MNGTDGPKRERKHVLIARELRKLELTVERIGNLINEIKGSSQASKPEIQFVKASEKLPELTLSEFLNGAADRLHALNEIIQKNLDEFRTELF